MARCQACLGRGSRPVAIISRYLIGPPEVSEMQVERICSACDGSGWDHCCEGLREQPSASDNSKSDVRRRSFGM
jgi:hypothetical protein